MASTGAPYPREPLWTLTGKLVGLTLALLVLEAGLAAGLARLELGLGIAAALALSLLVTVPLAVLSLRHLLEPMGSTIRALTDGVRSLHDRDFSMRITVPRTGELGELVNLYNRVGDLLRAERNEIYQRELLLDTVLQATPMAIVLANASNRVVYANRAARELFRGGRRLEGDVFPVASPSPPAPAVAAPAGDAAEPGPTAAPGSGPGPARSPSPLEEALAAGGDALFAVRGEGRDETFHVARRTFHLNTQRHTLHMVKRLTPELRLSSTVGSEAWNSRDLKSRPH